MSFPISGFIAMLGAGGRAADRAEAMMLYGRFVGSWDGTVIVQEAGGARREESAEVHFGWVLEGRAIQDVWIAPSTRTRGPGQASRMYGTTLRVYDPAQDHWTITWIDPARQMFRRMTGRAVGPDIVQEGRNEQGLRVQWMFTEIERDSFHWIARESGDEGETWRIVAEFFLRRRKAAEKK